MPDNSSLILVVDDEKFLLELWRELFELIDMPILTTDSGNKAIQIIESNDIDILITDLRMPESDGTDLLEYIKTSNKSDITTFVWSGFLNAQQFDLSNYEIERVISKPFDITEELDYFTKLLQG